jgi:hypothetical protein
MADLTAQAITSRTVKQRWRRARMQTKDAYKQGGMMQIERNPTSTHTASPPFDEFSYTVTYYIYLLCQRNAWLVRILRMSELSRHKSGQKGSVRTAADHSLIDQQGCAS